MRLFKLFKLNFVSDSTLANSFLKKHCHFHFSTEYYCDFQLFLTIFLPQITFRCSRVIILNQILQFHNRVLIALHLNLDQEMS